MSLPLSEHLLAAHLHGVAGDGDDALDEVALLVLAGT